MKFKKVMFIALSALVVPNLSLLFADDPATVQQQPAAETIIPAPTAAAPVTIAPTTEVKTTVPADVEDVEEEEEVDVDNMYSDFQKELTAALESIKTQGAIEAAPTPVETQPAAASVQPTTTSVAETQTAPAAVESTQG